MPVYDALPQKLSLNVADIPLALYIHIPWCVKKCPYCDFNSHELKPDADAAMYREYVDTLLADAKMQKNLAQGRVISSIFIGGGTPSLLPINEYQRLFEGLRACFEWAADIEITMEANPGTLEHAPFTEYLAVGINRLSIGVQSFDADKLTKLGRIHNPEQAVSAIGQARAAGFTRVNVDLMHGLPEQSADEALYDITTAHEAGATHISWYQLTIEPNTVFYRNQPVLPDETDLEEIEDAGQALLTRLGYRNYEVSAWAGKDDQPCRHNINYWQFGDYLAIGAGAHGKVSIDINHQEAAQLLDAESVSAGQIYRFSKSRLPKDYSPAISTTEAINTVPKMVNWQAIDKDELVSEFMLNALRLHHGASWALFEARTGLPRSTIAETVATLVTQGLLEQGDAGIIPSPLGLRYLNQVLHAFL
ncbi:MULTISPECIES: radical SAM family heme chaperone HemW [unclassified Psychrobacter]|uniref:radical SAM family heme chaperone HemW n=1 Tax=unclassified Psychrobacter TaxID=196806 RepID=UPI0018F70577|nr:MULTISPECIES: radical SAM family heme chaperone HemW [unclassified Psychrobacter]